MRPEKHHRAAGERGREPDGAERFVHRVGLTELREFAVLVVDEGKQPDRHAGDEQGRSSPYERFRITLRQRLFFLLLARLLDGFGNALLQIAGGG